MHTNFSWRLMEMRDLEKVYTIADEIHPQYPESPEIFAERLHLFPIGCLVAEDADEVVGYGISYPALLEDPPQLDTLVCELHHGYGSDAIYMSRLSAAL